MTGHVCMPVCLSFSVSSVHCNPRYTRAYCYCFCCDSSRPRMRAAPSCTSLSFPNTFPANICAGAGASVSEWQMQYSLRAHLCVTLNLLLEGHTLTGGNATDGDVLGRLGHDWVKFRRVRRRACAGEGKQLSYAGRSK